MIYLTGENVFTFNSGTEFSQFERLKAFNENGWESKLLLRNYNRMLAKDIADHHINSATVLNMYDYFQGVVGLERQEKPLRLLDSIAFKDYHVVGIDNNTSELRYQGKLVGKISVMPETIGLVGYIEYFDSLGYTMVKEYWDWRGFRSMVETYHPDGSVASQAYLRPDGLTALEVAHMYIGDQVLPTSFKLIDYHGKNYVFDTENQLFTFFLNEVSAQAPGVVISDRRTLDQCVLNVEHAKKKIAYIHSSPFIENKKPALGVLPIYREALIIGGFDQVIFPTAAGANDVKKAINTDLVTAVAPDSFVESKNKVKTLLKQKTIVYVGRFSEEKNIADLLKSFKIMYLQDDTLRFKLQGYFASPQYAEQLQKLVTNLKLQDVVEFIPYKHEFNIYENATLFLNASLSEGFGMNMLESMAYGVPVVSYAVPYTKDNLIKDGKNGFNVRNKTPQLLAQKALEVLGSEKQYQDLSKGALATAKEHDEQAFMSAWAKCLQVNEVI